MNNTDSPKRPYIVSARKYRPSTFRSVVGQPALTATLKNAVDTGRLAQAYLFCGPRGVGKTSCARIFAKTINCLHPTPDGEACNECESCRAFNEGRSLNVVELDAASNNSVDNIRSLNEQVQIPPQIGKYRVFIIDEVHMLSVAAFNAFLKTLEEPPAYVIFILATTEKHKVIPTILSRCQIYDFARITVPDISEHLAYVASSEGIEAEPSALDVIARKADGAMRDALSIFDQVAASSMGKITYKSAIDNLNVLDYEYYFRLVDAFLQGDVPGALLIYKEVRDAGFDSLSFVGGLGAHVRDLLVAADPATLPLLEVSGDMAERYKTQAARIKPQWAYKAMEIVESCDLNYRVTTAKQFLVELTLIKLCQLVNPKSATESAGVPSLAPLRKPAGEPASAPQPAADEHVAATAGKAPEPARRVMATLKPIATKARAPLASVAAKRVMINAQPATPPEAPEQAAKAATAPETATPAAQPDVVPDAEVLKRAWEEFRLSHPERHLLIATMRMCNPVQNSANPQEFVVKVEQPAQMKTIEDSMGELLEALRAATGAASLRLRIEVADAGERPKVLTSREFLDQAVKRYPAMEAMLKDLEAELIS